MLELNKVSCGYGVADVIHEISFNVNEGERICVIGPNGCGKTTILRAIAGLLPYRGSVTLNGRKLGGMSVKKRAAHVAYMGQFSSVYFPYTVLETVMMGMYSAEGRKSVETPLFAGATDFALYCMEQTGVVDLRDRPVTDLSGGQLQRVLLSRALAQDPMILLLDEPSNHLDIKHQESLLNILREWSLRPDRAVLAVFHDISLCFNFADKLLLLDNGRTAAFDNGEFFLRGDHLNQTFGTDVAEHMRKMYNMWK